jgi:hypothetical protein
VLGGYPFSKIESAWKGHVYGPSTGGPNKSKNWFWVLTLDQWFSSTIEPFSIFNQGSGKIKRTYAKLWVICWVLHEGQQFFEKYQKPRFGGYVIMEMFKTWNWRLQ